MAPKKRTTQPVSKTVPPASAPGSLFDTASDPAPRQPENTRAPRPFIGIQFKCCSTYGRIYRNHEANAYAGNCPRCGKRVNVPIRHGGGSARFFSAG
ncbi:hypothetical protein SAMN06265222_109180 [Neorhodopirellula lusitana]|uniref:Uncharacterized protein n=1 Tax=Neorhodopirellula lusitana TaxID=445327 RepID=A0ABY1QAY8_9BACT|nr:hypothetical protein [Neorhodopirellula lusitana]SMP66056.1 hypothetical protein SAMN06265222_109180 [Neorhodopirellula lusitana]